MLIVLGFLSFMVISAVSFAIYMRVERQSSSNYRHAVTARHLLESALYRAIDEVDAEVRGARYLYPPDASSETPDPNGGAPLVKFPDHWKGRVFASRPNSVEVEDARVLSIEALSFIPAALANDVRIFGSTNAFSQGPKWRRMSMPLQENVDIEDNRGWSSGGKSHVGRYAYVAVNLSDMLNVNDCGAGGRGVSNLVSIASLFSPPTDPSAANAFARQCSNDVHYATQQDFYACMATAQKGFFGSVMSDSPYLEFMRNPSQNLGFNQAYNHVLVTDGFAKAVTVKQNACNVTLNPPFSGAALSTGVGSVGPNMNPQFAAKIREVFPAEASIAQDGWPFQAMLADYLAKDSIGTMRLDAPSSKLTPMICQVRLAENVITPVIQSELTGTPPNTTIIYNLLLVKDPVAMAEGLGFQVRVCFPFKHVVTRIRPYTLNVEGFIRIDKQARNPNLTSQIVYTPPDDISFSGTATINPSPNDGIGDAQTVQDKCYQWVPLKVSIPVAPIKMADSRGGTFNGFSVNSKINLSLVVTSMKVQIGAAIYDSAPQMPPMPPLPDSPKLYFQTAEANIISGNPVNPFPIPYLWKSLEVPDPRFNHYVVNWINNTEDVNHSAVGMHQVTKDLLAQDGRDADIFMACSGSEVLQSVGELGFIVRPYKYDPLKGMSHVNFRDKKAIDPAKDDSDAFFRTIRLYDQGNKVRDKIYENFYMALDTDGTLPLNSKVRINPLSCVGPIIECALDRIPYNYSISLNGATMPGQNFTEGVLKDNWFPFVEAWARAFTNEVRISGLNTDLRKRVFDIYGDGNRMGWYSDEKVARKTIFKGFAAAVPVYEVDRKMLFSYSLDSMSDRQQLFLYVFQAESIAPISFAEMRSLSGGRALALVWRDPYPKGSNMDNPDGLTGSWYNNAPAGGKRSYHEHKILFFKQLDN